VLAAYAFFGSPIGWVVGAWLLVMGGCWLVAVLLDRHDERQKRGGEDEGVEA
jgi:hypothetical protein